MPALRPLLALPIALATAPAQAEEYLWLQAVAQGPVSGRIVTWLEVQQRFSASTDVTLLRPAIGVTLTRENGGNFAKSKQWQAESAADQHVDVGAEPKIEQAGARTGAHLAAVELQFAAQFG